MQSELEALAERVLIHKLANALKDALTVLEIEGVCDGECSACKDAAALLALAEQVQQ